jgi:hypothetical protein
MPEADFLSFANKFLGRELVSPTSTSCLQPEGLLSSETGKLPPLRDDDSALSTRETIGHSVS